MCESTIEQHEQHEQHGETTSRIHSKADKKACSIQGSMT